MRKIAYCFLSLLAGCCLAGCEPVGDPIEEEGDFPSDEALALFDKEANPRVSAINGLTGNFYTAAEDHYKDIALFIYSADMLKEYAFRCDEVVSGDKVVSSIALADYYADINWKKECLVVLSYQCDSVQYRLTQCSGTIFRNINKAYAVIDCEAKTVSTPSKGAYRYATAFVVDNQDFHRGDLFVKVNSAVESVGDDGEPVIISKSRVLDI